MEIKECVAVVSGGASGLGAATVRRIVALGGKAVILDIAAEKGESVAAEMGGNALFVQADATSEEEVQAALDKTAAAFGTLNVVVNCAGVADPGKILSRRGPLSLAAFRQVLSVNLVGTVNVVRLAVAQMVKNAPGPDGERGVIVNTASVAAFDGQIGQIAYAASKAGVVGLTLPLARECADYGIRAVTIAPGLFDTPLMAGLPEGVRIELAKTVPFPHRLGIPEEYARLAIHILENRMLNGECIRLDGALRMTAR